MNTEFSQITQSTVLVRVGFDLSDLQESARIEDARSTILALSEQGNKVVLLTHWGRPKGNDPELSLQKMLPVVEEVLGKKVEFVNQYVGFGQAKEVIQKSDSNLFILENTRFSEGEQSKDQTKRESLAKNYATLGDFFVNEAFSVSHRKEATNYELGQLLPSALGKSFQNEIQNLDALKHNPQSPFIVVMAGAKLETKLPLIEKMLTIADKIILGGMLCFTFIEARRELSGIEIPMGNSGIEENYLPKAKELLTKYPDKIVLPVDFIYGDLQANPIPTINLESKEFAAYDIGPETIALFSQELAKAQTIFWNGTMGYYEKSPFNHGTTELASFVGNLDQAFKVIGGGDTNSSLPENVLNTFNFVSMGGGATLEYLSS